MINISEEILGESILILCKMGQLLKELVIHPNNLNLMPVSSKRREQTPSCYLLTTTHIQGYKDPHPSHTENESIDKY